MSMFLRKIKQVLDGSDRLGSERGHRVVLSVHVCKNANKTQIRPNMNTFPLKKAIKCK
jgi:hypothetical protein